MIIAELRGLSKNYGNLTAVDSLDLIVQEGEILAILGPSGCGKTTLLQMIAGLEKADKGYINVAGQIFSSAQDKYFLSPEKRQVAMVFQKYALWPHYNVYQNIAYPLKIRRLCKKNINKEVKKALQIVQLENKELRYPHELSGGEQQRVALARALVMKPKLLLLDEPLSNLDAKLREEMQKEIRRIQKSINLSLIHVTHDQNEAMGIADRLAVMKDGKIIQIGSPREIYEEPVNEFVAQFFGSSNLIETRIKKSKKGRYLESSDGFIINDIDLDLYNDKMLTLSIRPEDIEINHHGKCRGRIMEKTYRGNLIDYAVGVGSNRKLLHIQTNKQKHYKEGEEISFSLQNARVIKSN